MDIHILIQHVTPHWYHKASGATETALNEVQTRMSVRLPDDYRTFLKWSNGGRGVFPSIADKKIGVTIWPAEEIADLNSNYQIQHYLGAQLIAFGDDGGDRHFLLDFRADGMQPTVAVVDGGDLSDESVKPLAGNFLEFMEKAWSGQIDEATMLL